jgi:hypothetical protein
VWARVLLQLWREVGSVWRKMSSEKPTIDYRLDSRPEKNEMLNEAQATRCQNGLIMVRLSNRLIDGYIYLKMLQSVAEDADYFILEINCAKGARLPVT